MKTNKIILLTFIALGMMSFIGRASAKKRALRTGIYGTCNCESSGRDPVKVELTLEADSTFHYFDNSNPEKKIDVHGNWTLANNTISLKNYKSDFRIHDKWKIDDNEKCLKSRKGLEITRLCHLKSCN